MSTNLQKMAPTTVIDKDDKIEHWFESEEIFNELYPQKIRHLSHRHWTPLDIAGKAADFLAASPGQKILDIGSGVGKFCAAAAHYKPECFFYGVEQREELFQAAESAKKTLRLKNVFFIHENVTSLALDQFDHFYFYNSFYENLVGTSKIDNKIVHSGELYNQYTAYLYKQLELVRKGTRLATYHAIGIEVPPGFIMVDSDIDNVLQFWIKC